MKPIITAIAVALTLTISDSRAQDAGGPPPPPDGACPQGGGERKHPAPPPLIVVLDANADGVIDATEIANAAEALKKLDKNGDGKLTPEETMPPRPPRPPGEGGGHGGNHQGGQQQGGGN